jgi:hypothetical protein
MSPVTPGQSPAVTLVNRGQAEVSRIATPEQVLFIAQKNLEGVSPAIPRYRETRRVDKG